MSNPDTISVRPAFEMQYTYHMDSKRTIYLFMFVGGMVGGYIPLLWGAGYFSFSSIIFNGLGALAGIWIGFKLTR